jgi:enamine deaminase RidA (YjgF/YER057c/UK114 family)
MTASTAPAFRNPATVAPPLGAYSHVVTVPGGSALIVLAGQVGNAPDGTCKVVCGTAIRAHNSATCAASAAASGRKP